MSFPLVSSRFPRRPGAHARPRGPVSRPGPPARAHRTARTPGGVWAGQRTLARTSHPARTCQRRNTSTRYLPAPGRSHTRAPARPRNTAELIARILDTESVSPAPRERGFRAMPGGAPRKTARNWRKSTGPISANRLDPYALTRDARIAPPGKPRKTEKPGRPGKPETGSAQTIRQIFTSMDPA